MKEIIRAIRRDKVLNLIEDESIKSDFENNKIKCSKCEAIITLDNIGAIKKENGQIFFICDNYTCINLQRIAE